MAEHLDNLLSRHHLFNETIDAGQALLLGREHPTTAFTQLSRGQHHDNGHQHGDECQRNAEHDHRRKGGHDSYQRGENLRQCRGNHLSERVHVIGIDRHDVTMRTLVKIAQRQPLHTFKDTLAQT